MKEANLRQLFQAKKKKKIWGWKNLTGYLLRQNLFLLLKTNLDGGGVIT